MVTPVATSLLMLKVAVAAGLPVAVIVMALPALTGLPLTLTVDTVLLKVNDPVPEARSVALAVTVTLPIAAPVSTAEPAVTPLAKLIVAGVIVPVSPSARAKLIATPLTVVATTPAESCVSTVSVTSSPTDHQQ
jgi:hypothetical protein